MVALPPDVVREGEIALAGFVVIIFNIHISDAYRAALIGFGFMVYMAGKFIVQAIEAKK